MSTRPAYRWLTGAVTVAAGVLFALAATTSRGQEIRADRQSLAQLVEEANERSRIESQKLQKVLLEVELLRGTQRDQDPQVADQLALAQLNSGLVAVEGPVIEVILNDAPSSALALGFEPQDLLVHQQDVQAVVNALWASGAEAMMIQDQRIVSTSAVRCVGNTLLLQGRVYSPPFTVRAMGDPEALKAGVFGDPQVRNYLDYVDLVGLGFEMRQIEQVRFPGYQGVVDLAYAQHAR